MRWLLLLSASGILLCGAAAPPTAATNIDINLCEFHLPDAVVKADVNFPIVVTFKTDDDGRPVSIEARDVRFVELDEVKACIEGWTIKSVRSEAPWTARFQWTYAAGWTSVSLSRGGERIVVRTDGGSRPQNGR